MRYQYTMHKKERVYEGFFKFNRHYVTFERFTGGLFENVMRECGCKGDMVSVLPYDPKRQLFLMVEQFRIGMAARQQHPWTLEIVAGFMDVVGESAEQTAKRELYEETGCTAIALYPLIDYYPSPGGSATQNHIFIATVDSAQAKKHTGIAAECEDILVHQIPLTKITKQLRQGQINNATALIAFQQFLLNAWAEKLQINL